MQVDNIFIRAEDNKQSIGFNVSCPDTDPYILKGVAGLDAEDILIRNVVTGNGQVDSRYEEPSSLASRDIVFLMGLNPDFSSGQTYSDLRDAVYRLISASRSSLLTVTFSGKQTKTYIQGFVSALEATHSEKSPELRLTIKCTQPIFRSFEYTELIELGTNILDVVDSVSTANHGFVLEGVFDDVADPVNGVDFEVKDDKDISLFSVSPINEGFLNGDIIGFSTEIGNKYIYYTRAGVTTYLAELVVPFSKWPQIFPGLNLYTFTEGFTIALCKHKASFWGV